MNPLDVAIKLVAPVTRCSARKIIRNCNCGSGALESTGTVPPVTVNVCVPAAVGVPLPVRTIVPAPVAVNVPVPLNIIPFTAGDVVTLQVPTVVTVTLSVIVFAAVSAVPATYVPTGVAPVQLIVNTALPRQVVAEPLL